jgi:hypothetical protein
MPEPIGDQEPLRQEVRARLLAGLTPAQSSHHRRSLLYQAAGIVLLFVANIAGRNIDVADQILAGVAGVTVILSAFGYRRLRPGPRLAVSDGAVARAMRSSRRCGQCRALLLPMDASVCPACGKEHRDSKGVLVALAVGMAMLVAVMWYLANG